MKHLNIILTEMFRRVGDEYAPSKTEGEEWYLAHEWTEEEQDAFVKWLTEYFYTTTEARRELMNLPFKNKKRCREAADWFNFMYGWKTKRTS
jgi:hypothetical protein